MYKYYVQYPIRHLQMAWSSEMSFVCQPCITYPSNSHVVTSFLKKPNKETMDTIKLLCNRAEKRIRKAKFDKKRIYENKNKIYNLHGMEYRL